MEEQEAVGWNGPLSKVNEQKDNVLAPNTALSPSHSLAGGVMGGVTQVLLGYFWLVPKHDGERGV